ncbi:MAG: hypothetical protein J7L20_05410, partial [Thermoplasmata archaeon]|nr:hypothetical protein [Thermoplasmata archaeon]
MKVDVKNRLLSTSIAILMLTSGLVMLANTRGASVTNNNAPEALVPPGATDVLVANFTLDGTIDETIAGTAPNPGVELTTDNPWSDVYFYDDGDGVWDDTKDAIWQDNGRVYYDDGLDTWLAGATTENALGAPDGEATDWSQLSYIDAVDGDDWDASADTIFDDANANDKYDSGEVVLAGVTPPDGTPESGDGVRDPDWTSIYTHDEVDGNAWDPTVDILWPDDGNIYYDSGFDDVIVGASPPENTPADTTNPWANADQPVAFYDDGDDTWDNAKDWIGLDVNADNVYDEFIKEIRVKNTGTATTDEIASVALWLDDGDKIFEPIPGQDTGPFVFATTTDEKTWKLPGSFPIWADQLWFLSMDINTIGPTFSLKRNTIKVKVDIDVVSSPNITLSFTNKYTQKIALLGVTYFEGNQDGPADVIATDTKDIKYDATVTLKVNTSCLSPGTYYLYYPHYKKTGSGGSYDYDLEWLPYYYEGVQPSVTVDASGGIKEMTASVYFNISGIWVLDNDAGAEDFNNPGGAGDGNYAYFWVNGTEAYSVDISKTEVTYGKNESVKVTITEDGSTPPGVWVDIRRESDEFVTPVLRKFTTNGTVTFTVDTDRFLAGNYTIFVYRDLDVVGITNNYDEDGVGYTEWYGITHPDLTGEVPGNKYRKEWGTFDPPEKISAVKKIVVKTGKPQLEIPEINKTMYWNFSGEVKVIIKGYDGKNLSLFNANNVKVYNSEGDEVTDNLTIEPTTGSSHIIKIRPGPSASGWGRDD